MNDGNNLDVLSYKPDAIDFLDYLIMILGFNKVLNIKLVKLSVIKWPLNILQYQAGY